MMRLMLMGIIFLAAVCELPAAESLAEFTDAVSELVKIRGEQSRERLGWREMKTQMAREHKQLVEQQAVLAKRIQAIRQKRKEMIREQEDLKQKKERLRATLAAMVPELEKAEKQLEQAQTALPRLFQKDLQTEFRKLRASDNRNIASRLQIVLSLYSTIGKLAGSVTLRKQIIDIPGGKKKECDVIYLGLAAAYAVSVDDTQAAFSFPDSSGNWTWTWDNKLAARIRDAVDITNKMKPAACVKLPLKITQ